MAWPETDKALAELLLKLPAAIAVLFLMSVGYFVIRNKHLFEDERWQSDPLGHFSNPAPQAEQIPTDKHQQKKQDPNADLLIPAILKASDHANDGKHHILLCATGSVATIKIPNIAEALSAHKNVSIRILLTESACQFLQGQASEQPKLSSILQLPNVDGIYRDADEWHKPWVRGDHILHIELRRWADIMVIVPLSANALAKLAMGLSDNLVYSVARAWDTTGLIDEARPGIRLPYTGRSIAEGKEGKVVRKKGVLVAPAMNTAMWNHPVTKRHLDVLEREWNVANGGWIEVLRPIDKGLACGDKGGGGMREWKEIVKVLEDRLELGGRKRATVEEDTDLIVVDS
ncbi:Putative flavoprotein [Septoria linicola]|uniref:Flavoprotein n=1 Tax=Septoria linicola TaxID=215465 RepID=A0A9Q9B7I3_9PEZI|nr:Putative flavoprotein [Septoria linicola]